MDEVANDSSPFGMDIARTRPFGGGSGKKTIEARRADMVIPVLRTSSII